MRCLILGGAGFIGMALNKRLLDEGHYVASVDIRKPPFEPSVAHNFVHCDLREKMPWLQPDYDEVYQLACDMGGAGYIFTGERDAQVMANNVRINTNVAQYFSKAGCGRLLYTSSSCVYNDEYADWIKVPMHEDEADFNHPSNGYGWEKLFSERLYEAHRANHKLNVCITRFSTIYGPGSAFADGREKAVAAICRKVHRAPPEGEVEVWGDGKQVRPLVYIDDLIDAIVGLVRCKSFNGPMNVASTELTTCDEIAAQAISLSNKRLKIKHVPGPIGKQDLRMTTNMAETHIGWKASTPFAVGLERTFNWIGNRIHG